MKIDFSINTSGSERVLPTILVPITKNEYLSEVLSVVAKNFEFDFDTLKHEFKAEPKEVLNLFHRNSKIVLFGIGSAALFHEVMGCFRSYVFQQKHKLTSNVGISVDYAKPYFPRITEAAINGVLLGRYSIGLYKTEKSSNFLFNNDDAVVTVVTEDLEHAKAEAQLGAAVAATQLKMFDLVNNPSNVKTPKYLAEKAIESGAQNGFSVKVFDKAACIENKFDALLAVNKGSAEEPVMIVMEYVPEVPSGRSLGLVGKGVTFDTGGISIKPSNNMHYMKSDMGGAAAVIGAIEIIAKLKLPIHVVAVVPSTENCVDGNAVKPGDVINSYAGKSIEVIDTDAEGRLILADALSYLTKNYKVESIIDFATLTGSCLRTFGYVCSGLFSNNDTLSEQLFRAGEATGERMWRLPIWEAYADDLKSDIADLKNFSGKPSAGAISAAKFLEVFIDGHTSWAHLDIAGTAFSDSEYATQKIGTAYGVRLILAYVEQLLKSN